MGLSMIKEAYLLFFVKVITAFLGFAVTALVARELTDVEVGSYFLLLSLINILIPFSIAGLGYNIIKIEGGFGECFSFAFVFIVLSSFFISLIVVFFYYLGFFLAEVDNLYWFISPLIIINCLSDFLSYAYQRARKAWLGGFLLVMLRQLLMIIMLFSSDNIDLNDLLQYSIWSGVLSLLVSCYFIRKIVSISFPSINKGFTYLKQSNTFMYNHIMAAINGSIIPVLLGIISTSSNVAYFTIALKVASLTSFVLIPLNRVVAPRFSKNFNANDFVGLKNTSRLSSKLAIFLTVPLVGFMFIFSQPILSYFGESYLDRSLVVLYIMLIGQLINGLSGSVGWLLQMSNNEKLYRNISLVNIILSIILAYLLIPYMGAVGAAITYSFSLIFMNVVSYFYVKKILNINIYKFWS